MFTVSQFELVTLQISDMDSYLLNYGKNRGELKAIYEVHVLLKVQ